MGLGEDAALTTVRIDDVASFPEGPQQNQPLRIDRRELAARALVDGDDEVESREIECIQPTGPVASDVNSPPQRLTARVPVRTTSLVIRARAGALDPHQTLDPALGELGAKDTFRNGRAAVVAEADDEDAVVGCPPSAPSVGGREKCASTRQSVRLSL